MGGNDWEPGDADMNKNCRNDFVVISMNQEETRIERVGWTCTKKTYGVTCDTFVGESWDSRGLLSDYTQSDFESRTYHCC